ncbi:Detected protein of unknown function [Hibiscus syriacus]|uniref:Uncharacterized protein n=1 Tax=Hibiscus syriacus TaxID=106335 RepID=A0A6A3D0J0_HIBSY|nr:Detected protein of unknown function [Hibiscus syriacus]
MMMKGGKYEASVMNPMFPRLHVNDTEKGGPKAPPRNKMALYEQLIIPSRRFNSGSQPMLPLSPNNTNILVPSTSSSYASLLAVFKDFLKSYDAVVSFKFTLMVERNMFLSLVNSHESSVLPDEKFGSCSTPGTEINYMKGSRDRKSAKTTEYCSLDPLEPSISLTSRNFLCDPSIKIKNSGTVKAPYSLLNRENKSITVDMLNGDVPNARLHLKENILMESGRCLENASMLKIELCSRQSHGLDNGSMTHEEKTRASIQLEGINRHNNVPDVSVADYTSAFDICPDDVVGIIGEKHFWVVRRAIAKVEYADENAFDELPCSSANDDTSKGLFIKWPKYGPYSGKASSTPRASDSGPSPWCVSPLRSLWLVPIMSPLEGLVYKPFTGPSPLTAGLFTPVYGSSDPLNLAVGSLEFPNMANRVAASQQHEIGILQTDPPKCPSNFPHYGQLEHMSQVTTVQSKANFTIAQPGSCNMSSQPSEALSYRATEPPPASSNETSSHRERVKVDALPLFPTKPIMPSSNHEERTPAIKVIPYSRTSATESAACIFRCIQEERKQHE